MNTQDFLTRWAKNHPVTEPPVATENQVMDWLTTGGPSPLPLWPDLEPRSACCDATITETGFCTDCLEHAR